jgi:dTDP-4-amino-4,6-dideoxygalactose transaminase
MAQMEELNQLCSKWDLPVVEDAACALGSVRNERQAGAWGKVGCFSFHPRKAITTGEGGMLTTNDDSLAGRLRALRNHGLNSTSTVQDFIMPGHNYRMTEFQAALGCSQMGKLQRIISSRSRAAKVYDKLLSKNPLRVPHVQSGGTHVYQSYVTLLPEHVIHRRTELIRLARASGVETQIGTIHMPLTTFYKSRYCCKAGDFPVTDRVAAAALTLPLYETITEEDQEEAVRVITKLIS